MAQCPADSCMVLRYIDHAKCVLGICGRNEEAASKGRTHTCCKQCTPTQLCFGPGPTVNDVLSYYTHTKEHHFVAPENLVVFSYDPQVIVQKIKDDVQDRANRRLHTQTNTRQHKTNVQNINPAYPVPLHTLPASLQNVQVSVPAPVPAPVSVPSQVPTSVSVPVPASVSFQVPASAAIPAPVPAQQARTPAVPEQRVDCKFDAGCHWLHIFEHHYKDPVTKTNHCKKNRACEFLGWKIFEAYSHCKQYNHRVSSQSNYLTPDSQPAPVSAPVVQQAPAPVVQQAHVPAPMPAPIVLPTKTPMDLMSTPIHAETIVVHKPPTRESTWFGCQKYTHLDTPIQVRGRNFWYAVCGQETTRGQTYCQACQHQDIADANSDYDRLIEYFTEKKKELLADMSG